MKPVFSLYKWQRQCTDGSPWLKFTGIMTAFSTKDLLANHRHRVSVLKECREARDSSRVGSLGKHYMSVRNWNKKEESTFYQNLFHQNKTLAIENLGSAESTGNVSNSLSHPMKAVLLVHFSTVFFFPRTPFVVVFYHCDGTSYKGTL